jgi:hypothetical protein
MNADEFEKKLRALADGLHRPDPTPAWKTDILARARREADAAPREHMLPPRWFMAALGVAWVAILVMNLATPRDPQPPTAQDFAVAKPMPTPDAMLPADAWALIALHQRMNPGPESLR